MHEQRPQQPNDICLSNVCPVGQRRPLCFPLRSVVANFASPAHAHSSPPLYTVTSMHHCYDHARTHSLPPDELLVFAFCLQSSPQYGEENSCVRAQSLSTLVESAQTSGSHTWLPALLSFLCLECLAFQFCAVIGSLVQCATIGPAENLRDANPSQVKKCLDRVESCLAGTKRLFSCRAVLSFAILDVFTETSCFFGVSGV